MHRFLKLQPRYRTSTLLIGITLACVVLTVLPHEARQYHQLKGRTRSLVVSLGGTVETAGYIDRPSPGANWLSERLGYTEARESLWNVDLAGTSVSVADVEQLSKCDWIVVLNLSHTNIQDDTLDHVARLGELRALKLANTEVTDFGLAKLVALVHLRILDVAGTATTYDCLAKLQQALPGTNFQEQLAIGRVRARGIVVDGGTPLPSSVDRGSLKSLMASVKSELNQRSFVHAIEPETAGSIHFTQPIKLSKQDVDDLRRLKSANRLLSSGVTFPDSGLSFLASFPNLESVTIDDAAKGNLSDDDMPWLAQLPRLKTLDLRSGNLTDAALSHLARSRSLAALRLVGNGFTDAGFADLSGMHQLQTLSVQGHLTPHLLYHLRGLTGLRQLDVNLWYTGDDDKSFDRPPEAVIAHARKGMKYAAEISNLKQFSLRGNLMVADVLPPLTQIPSLVWIQVDGRFVTHEEARELQIAMPHCHVQRLELK